MTTLYRKQRKRNEKTPTFRSSFSLSPATVTGLNAIRSAFHAQYPKAAYPSLAYALEFAIAKNLKRLVNDPDAMAAEVADFEKKYPAGSPPKDGSENDEVQS